MSRSYVFLIHGVGKHDPDTWSTPWKDGIIRELKRYEPYKNVQQEVIEKDLIRFVPIGYDAIFEGYRNRWHDLAGALADNAVIKNPSVRKALEWVAAPDGDDSKNKFFWENVLDALLWQTFPEARAAVIARVVKQCVDGIKEMMEENKGADNAHFVAHSLGTSVLHDSLVSLALQKDLHEGAFDPSRFKWQSVFMVANTSRLLQSSFDISNSGSPEDYKVYNSHLKPGGSKSLCRSYFSVRHRADPITWPRSFAPVDWPSVSYSDLETVNYDELKEVHDFNNYLANPLVHLTLIRKILGNNKIGSQEEVRLAVKEFQKEHNKTAGQEFSDLRDLLNGNFDRDLSTKELVEYLVRAYKELK